jgi:Na+-driven multidrug efflux pump
MAADGRLDELAAMVRRASKRVYLAALPIGAVVVLGYAVVVPAISSEPGLAASWIYFAVLVAGTVAGAGYAPFNQLLLWAHRPGWHSLMMIAVVGLGALLDVALVSTLGVLGLACAVALSYALAVLAFKLFVRRVLDLSV